MPRANLHQKYPGSSSEAIDFLQRILVFNPYFRGSLDTFLEHEIFAGIRNPAKESIAGQPVVLDFENEDLTTERLRELLLAECQYYRDLRSSN